MEETHNQAIAKAVKDGTTANALIERKVGCYKDTAGAEPGNEQQAPSTVLPFGSMK